MCSEETRSAVQGLGVGAQEAGGGPASAATTNTIAKYVAASTEDSVRKMTQRGTIVRRVGLGAALTDESEDEWKRAPTGERRKPWVIGVVG